MTKIFKLLIFLSNSHCVLSMELEKAFTAPVSAKRIHVPIKLARKMGLIDSYREKENDNIRYVEVGPKEAKKVWGIEVTKEEGVTSLETLVNLYKIVKRYSGYSYVPLDEQALSATKKQVRIKTEEAVATVVQSISLPLLQKFCPIWENKKCHTIVAFVVNQIIDRYKLGYLLRKKEKHFLKKDIPYTADHTKRDVSLDDDVNIPLDDYSQVGYSSTDSDSENEEEISEDMVALINKYAVSIDTILKENPVALKYNSSRVDMVDLRLRTLAGLHKWAQRINNKESIITFNVAGNLLQTAHIGLIRNLFPNCKSYIYSGNPLQEVDLKETEFGDSLYVETSFPIKNINFVPLISMQPINLYFSLNSLSDLQKEHLSIINIQKYKIDVCKRIFLLTKASCILSLMMASSGMAFLALFNGIVMAAEHSLQWFIPTSATISLMGATASVGAIMSPVLDDYSGPRNHQSRYVFGSLDKYKNHYIVYSP